MGTAALAAGGCASPLLAAWARMLSYLYLHLVCPFLHVDGMCEAPSEQVLCSAEALPGSRAAPITLLTCSLVLAILTAAAALAVAAQRLHAWYAAQQGAVVVSIASKTLAELRKMTPAQHPPASHHWFLVPTGEVATPLLCAACNKGIDGRTPGASMQCCACCGLAAHDGSCARKMARTCRPLCLPGGAEGMPHFWQACGTVRDEERQGADSVSPCLYCRELCDADMFSAEPLWRCTHCSTFCHVGCFCEAHAQQLPSVAARYHALMERGTAGDKGWGLEGGSPPPSRAGSMQANHAGFAAAAAAAAAAETANQAAPAAAGREAGSGAQGSPGSSSEDDQQQQQQQQHRAVQTGLPNGSEAAAACSQQQPWPEPGLQSLASRILRSAASSLSFLDKGPRRGSGFPADESGYSSDTESDILYDPRQQRRRQQRRRRRKVQLQDVVLLDRCSMGPLRQVVLPPTAVRQLSRSPSRSNLAASSSSGKAPSAVQLAGWSDGGGRTGDKAARPNGSPQQQQQQQGKKKGGGKRGGGSKGKSWWRRAFGPKTLQWSDYQLNRLPAGSRPVLVFVNTKSGPQVGPAMRRRFLRLLHPLQVVELPREKPEPALQLFCQQPGLRLLVVGGDGTAGWILSCLDRLREGSSSSAAAALSSVGWRPPPLGILPLGTGNDLARVLNWGGGYGAWRTASAASILEEVVQAGVVLIDRWSLAFHPPSSQAPNTAARGTVGSSAGQQESSGSRNHAHGGGLLGVVRQYSLTKEGGPLVGGLRRRLTAAAAAPQQQQQQGTASAAGPPGNSSGAGAGELEVGAAGGGDSSGSPGTGQGGKKDKDKKDKEKLLTLSMNNYLGIGVDAHVALGFHQMREKSPALFVSQVGNKMVYTGVGAVDVFSPSGHACQGLPLKMKVVCDGQEVALPQDAEGLLVLNIPSFMGGVDLWGTGYSIRGGSEDEEEDPGDIIGQAFAPATGGSVLGLESVPGGSASFNGRGAGGGTTARRQQATFDGRLELVAVFGSFHLGQLQVGLARALRLAQGAEVVIETSVALPMQVDGEPFMQSPSRITIRRFGQAPLLRRVESKPLARAVALMSEVLESGEARGVITTEQHHALSAELAARMQPLLQSA